MHCVSSRSSVSSGRRADASSGEWAFADAFKLERGLQPRHVPSRDHQLGNDQLRHRRRKYRTSPAGTRVRAPRWRRPVSRTRRSPIPNAQLRQLHADRGRTARCTSTSDFDVGLNNGWALPNYRAARPGGQHRLLREGTRCRPGRRSRTSPATTRACIDEETDGVSTSKPTVSSRSSATCATTSVRATSRRISSSPATSARTRATGAVRHVSSKMPPTTTRCCRASTSPASSVTGWCCALPRRRR